MIHYFRKIVDSFIAKILMVLIILSFSLWGANDYLISSNVDQVVTFRYANNITEIDFAKEKYRDKDIPESATTNESKELQSLILNNLINDRMILNFASDERINVGNKSIVSEIKKNPEFKSDDGNFDIEKFKKILSQNHNSEEEFYRKIRDSITKKLAISSLVDDIRISDFLKDLNLNYQSSKLLVDLASFDIEKSFKKFKYKISKEELENFYENNKFLYKIGESFDVKVLEINKKSFSKQIDNISDEEFKSYVKNYMANLSDREIDVNKNNILEEIKEKKLSELFRNLGQELEESVSAGANFSEISEKYNLKPLHFLLEKNSIMSNDLFAKFHNEIINLAEGEISYPLDNNDKNNRSIIIVLKEKINPEKIAELQDVQLKVEKDFLVNKHREILQENAKQLYESKNHKEFLDNAKKLNFNIVKNHELFRNSDSDNSKISKELHNEILRITKENEISNPVVVSDGKIIMFYVSKIYINDSIKKKIAKDFLTEFQNKYVANLIDELVAYYKEINLIQYNKKLLNQ